MRRCWPATCHAQRDKAFSKMGAVDLASWAACGILSWSAVVLSRAAPGCLPGNHCMLRASPGKRDPEDALAESFDL